MILKAFLVRFPFLKYCFKINDSRFTIVEQTEYFEIYFSWIFTMRRCISFMWDRRAKMFDRGSQSLNVYKKGTLFLRIIENTLTYIYALQITSRKYPEKLRDESF